MQQSLQQFCMAAALLVLLSGQARAATGPAELTDLYLYPTIQYFRWAENANGHELLRESGPRYGIGGGIGLNLFDTGNAGSLRLRARGELFGGWVTYDGQTMNNDERPAQSERPVTLDATYIGLGAETALGWRVDQGQYHFEPFIGIGYRWWFRDLGDGRAIDTLNRSFEVEGYTEFWQRIYARMGMDAGYRISGDLGFFLTAGTRYPLYTSTSVEIEEDGTLTLHPTASLSGFAEAGFRYGKFRPALYYEGFRTGASPTVHGFYQPASTEDIFGVSIGYCFR